MAHNRSPLKTCADVLGSVCARYTVTRPDGTRWTRTFASEAAAWRVLVPGLAGAAFRQRRADLMRAGWRVRAG